jgi:hypothetical protein
MKTSAQGMLEDAGSMSTGIITCSFRGDLDACRLLCESIDRHVPDTIRHTVFVPQRDVPLFAGLGSPRRTIATQESLLPRGFWKVPLPGPGWRARLHLPRRDVFLTPYSLPVRGWIAQQIMKLAASADSATEIIVHIDSDNVFVRPLTIDRLCRDGKVRLYRNPVKVDLATHRRWHSAAGRLLGLPPSDFYDAEYIDSLVVWRRSVAQGVVARIAAVAKTDWRIALARTHHFAEYILYGVFADKVLGLEAAGQFAATSSLCHSRWSDDFADSDDERAFIESIGPEHLTCLLQSTIAVSGQERRRIMQRTEDFAAQQDALSRPA